MKTVRCAIYTRKSSDEGLDQSFNSLDAQREACAAYILSQASEGWSALPDMYDDGGLSGGTLERPALRRLLAEVAAGRVDIIVVYKVDRLTRSLFDFAKLVETFDKSGTSFVSVTQSFNTTTSMGRLTLNMLLSFAQFEREVTAERIRDKIAASKARGMWMGGTPPLGYAPDGRSLAIVEDHAALIRDVFSRYLRVGSVPLLEADLRRERIAIPQRQTISGKPIGGGWFSRGHLYLMLRNVIYTGRIAHKGTVYPGQHASIVDDVTFDAVQAALSANTQGQRSAVRAAHPAPLAGRIVDVAGDPLVSTHTSKGKVRHRYYVSHALHHGRSDTGLRLPAREIETLVTNALVELTADPLTLATTISINLAAIDLSVLYRQCEALGASLQERHSSAFARIVQQVTVAPYEVSISIDAAELAAVIGARRMSDVPATATLTCKARLTRSGRALRLVQDNGTVAVGMPDKALVRLLVQARGWWAALRTGAVNTSELAKREGVTPSYLARVLRLAFLAPAVTEAVLAGRQRAGVTVASLTLGDLFPADWQSQIALLLPAPVRR